MGVERGIGCPVLAAAVLLVALAGACAASDGRALPGDGGVEVVGVTDGDTLRVVVDGAEEPVRLIGVDAPEAGECLAEAAGEELRALLEEGTVRLEADVSDRDRFGRLLRYVHAGDVFVNEALVERGLAIARRFEPDVARSDELEAAQRRARAEGAGQWAPDACGPPSAADIAVVEVVADAPGDDAENLNGEWVVLRNDGADPVDLTGWVVKDESATHRFRFPDGFVLDAGSRVTIFSGCGTDGADRLFWCVTGSAVWNNDGDTVFVLDRHGNVVTARPY